MHILFHFLILFFIYKIICICLFKVFANAISVKIFHQNQRKHVLFSSGLISYFNSNVVFGEVWLEAEIKFIKLKNFKNVVKNVNIVLRREIKWKKNAKVRTMAICRIKENQWVALYSWHNSSCIYQTKTLDLEHRCCRVFRNKSTNRDWVANKLKHILMIQPGLRRSQAYKTMKEKYLVHINKKKLSMALKKAKFVVEGCEKEQHGRIWNYWLSCEVLCENVQKTQLNQNSKLI